MTVITTRMSVSLVRPEICNLCANRLQPPWVEWHGAKSFAICGKCCRSIKNGLMADLIQCAAIVELNQVYGAFTLERDSRHAIERREAKANPDLAVLVLKNR